MLLQFFPNGYKSSDYIIHVYGVRPNTVPVHLYYIPIIIAAWYWGVKGGLIVGIISGLLAGPFMLLTVSENINQLTWSWVSRLCFYSGVKILSKLHDVDHIIDVVMYHHERIDRLGYPHGKIGEELSMQAKILAVADVWDVINSDRSYRKKLDRDVALKIMIDGRGTQFDPVVLDAFLQIELRETNVSIMNTMIPL